VGSKSIIVEFVNKNMVQFIIDGGRSKDLCLSEGSKLTRFCVVFVPFLFIIFDLLSEFGSPLVVDVNDSIEQSPEQDITEHAAEDAFCKDIEWLTKVRAWVALGLDEEDQEGEEGGSKKVKDESRPVGKTESSGGETEDGRVR